jgi:hypothetical protein
MFKQATKEAMLSGTQTGTQSFTKVEVRPEPSFTYPFHRWVSMQRSDDVGLLSLLKYPLSLSVLL